MSVLNTTVIPGLDGATCDEIIAQLGWTLRAARGFSSHLAYPGPATTPTVTHLHDLLPAAALTP